MDLKQAIFKLRHSLPQQSALSIIPPKQSTSHKTYKLKTIKLIKLSIAQSLPFPSNYVEEKKHVLVQWRKRIQHFDFVIFNLEYKIYYSHLGFH